MCLSAEIFVNRSFETRARPTAKLMMGFNPTTYCDALFFSGNVSANINDLPLIGKTHPLNSHQAGGLPTP